MNYTNESIACEMVVTNESIACEMVAHILSHNK